MELIQTCAKMSDSQFAMFIDNKSVRKLMSQYDWYNPSVTMDSDVVQLAYLKTCNAEMDNTDLHKLEHIANEIIESGGKKDDLFGDDGDDDEEKKEGGDGDDDDKDVLEPDTTLIENDLCYYSDSRDGLYKHFKNKDEGFRATINKAGDGDRFPWRSNPSRIGWMYIKQVPLDHIEDDALRKEVAQLRLAHLEKENPVPTPEVTLPATPPTPPPTPPSGATDAFSMMLNGLIENRLSTLELGVSEEALALEVKKAFKGYNKSIKFRKPGAEKPITIDSPHKSFEEMMLWINQGENVMLSGPAGSGKTTAGALAAKALDLPFGSLSLSNDTRAYALFGFTNGQNYTTTEFRRLYENGGVFVLDEVDNGQANILSKLNSALENGQYAFDDKVVKRHPDFVCISTANTWGHGGDREYVGRNALDAAFLDRFIKIDWGYDEKLELRIAPNENFTRKIQQIRAAATRMKYKIIVSPRASIRGGKMIDSGKMTENKVLDAVLWRGVSNDVKKKILANV